MASLFAKKQSSDREIESRMSEISTMVRTMKDDLDDIKNGRRPPMAVAAPQLTQSSIPTRNPFAEEGGSSSDNPFGVVSQASPTQQSGFIQGSTLENGLTEIIQGAITVDRPKKSKKWLWIAIIVIVTVAALSGGAYVYMTGQKLKTAVSSEKTAPIPEIETESRPKELPFVLDKANYLSINTETVSPTDIRNELFRAAERAREAGITVPVEFRMTDRNNNPLAFSRFAFLLKLDIDPDLLALINETFSLFVYDDAGNSRLGLVLVFKDPVSAAALLAKSEPTLPYVFQPFVYESGILVSKNSSFRSGSYNQYAVRFANIDSSRNISLDYALKENSWYIGMSKNTLRAILDKNGK